MSLSIFDQNGNEMAIAATGSDRVELIIPRDPNLTLPPMSLQNATALNLVRHAKTFNLHFVNLTAFRSAISLHLEMRPLLTNLSYLLVYKFDGTPQVNSSVQEMDGWSLLCSPSSFFTPSSLSCSLRVRLDLSNESMYTYFLDNLQTKDHQSFVFGLRELNATETMQYCFNRSSASGRFPISDQPFHFTVDYELRLYTSGCYYLDSNNQWQSDGLVVSVLADR